MLLRIVSGKRARACRLAICAVALAAAAAPAAGTPFARVVDRLAAAARLSGTVLIADRGRTVYRRSFGIADRAFVVPATPDTRYKIASVTKLFTAVLVLQLRDAGRLDLEARADSYLPELAGHAAGAVTIRQLLNHSSGLPQWDDVASLHEAFARGVEKYQRPLIPQELVRRCCLGALVSAPGSRFDYNNADYFVLGRIIERVGGRPYEAVLAGNLLEPLRLADTGMLHWDSVVPRLAPTYFQGGGDGRLMADMPIYYENWYAAGGMYSTAADLARFASALYGGRLLSRESLERLLDAGLDDYGLGLWSYTIDRGGRRYRVAKRPGRILGANAMLYRLLDRPATIVILANDNRADLDVLAQRIADGLVGGRLQPGSATTLGGSGKRDAKRRARLASPSTRSAPSAASASNGTPP